MLQGLKIESSLPESMRFGSNLQIEYESSFVESDEARLIQRIEERHQTYDREKEVSDNMSLNPLFIKNIKRVNMMDTLMPIRVEIDNYTGEFDKQLFYEYYDKMVRYELLVEIVLTHCSKFECKKELLEIASFFDKNLPVITYSFEKQARKEQLYENTFNMKQLLKFIGEFKEKNRWVNSYLFNYQ